MPCSRTYVLFTSVLVTCGVFTFPAWERVLRRSGVDAQELNAEGRWHRPFSANDLSNLATIRVLVEQGTWAIDASGYSTSDQALIDGHYYSVRPPVLPFLASGVYWVLYHVLGWQLTPDGGFGACHWVLAMIFSGGSLALTAVLLARCVSLIQRRNENTPHPSPHTLHSPLPTPLSATSLLAGGLFAWGSLALPYAVVLNHHVVAACLITGAAYLLLRGELDGVLSPVHAALAGGCAGLAATIDVAGGGLFLLGFLGWVVTVPALRRQIVWGALAVAAAGALHGVLNGQITGDVVPVLVRPEYIEFPGATLKSSQLSGFLNHESLGAFVSYLGGLLLASPGDGFSPRGLFVYTPAAFFAMVAGIRMVRRVGSGEWGVGGPRNDRSLRTPHSTPHSQPSTPHPLRWLALYLGGASVLYLLYLSLFTNNYSGGCYGVRWFVLLLPVVYLLLFGGWGLLSTSERVGAAVSLLAAVPLAWWGLVTGAWQGMRVFPWVFHYTWAMPMLFVVALAAPIVHRWLGSRLPT